MSILQVVSGPFDATYAGAVMGFTRRGFDVQFMNHAEPINETDTYARSLLDAVHQGGDCTIHAIYRIWSQAVADMMNPFSKTNASLGELDGGVSIGDLYSNLADELILDAVLGTPAAASFPSSITAEKAIIAPNSGVSFTLTSMAREVPIALALLPYGPDAGPNTWFTMT